MAAQMKERTGSSARIVLLALLGDTVYENSGGSLAFEARKYRRLIILLCGPFSDMRRPSNSVMLIIANVQKQVRVQIEYKDAC